MPRVARGQHDREGAGGRFDGRLQQHGLARHVAGDVFRRVRLEVGHAHAAAAAPARGLAVAVALGEAATLKRTMGCASPVTRPSLV